MGTKKPTANLRSMRAKAQGASGRPPKRYAYSAETLLGQRDAARGAAAASLGRVVDFWIALVDGRYPDAEISDRIRAAENLADRAGLVRKSELELGVESDVKLWRLGTYRTKDGERHVVPAEDSPGDPQPA